MRRLTKGTAFYAGFSGILGLCALVAWRAPSSLESVTPEAMLALVGLVVSFSGANVADNAFKGKFYRSELDSGKGKE